MVGGGGPEGAARAAQSIATQVQALISFGLAGGLDPALPPGALIVPSRVVDGDESWAADPALMQALGGSTGHTLLGGGTLLATAAVKRAAHATTGAHAVDLESAATARVAALHTLPFAVLRAICDTATHDLPDAAVLALDAEGRIGPWRVARAALSRPTQLPSLITLARHAAQARRALLARIVAEPGRNQPDA